MINVSTVCHNTHVYTGRKHFMFMKQRIYLHILSYAAIGILNRVYTLQFGAAISKICHLYLIWWHNYDALLWHIIPSLLNFSSYFKMSEIKTLTSKCHCFEGWQWSSLLEYNLSYLIYNYFRSKIIFGLHRCLLCTLCTKDNVHRTWLVFLIKTYYFQRTKCIKMSAEKY